jgi:U3 small nucleolar RNA-associated protein 22
MIDIQSDGSDDEDEDEDGDEDAEVDDVAVDDNTEVPVAGPSKKQKVEKKGLYKAPTLEEMDKLRANEQTGGNTFSLQVSEW